MRSSWVQNLSILTAYFVVAVRSLIRDVVAFIKEGIHHQTEPEIEPGIARDFMETMKSIANIRKENRSTAILVTNKFAYIIDTYSIYLLFEYVDELFHMTRVRDAGGEFYFVKIDTSQLKSYNRRFFWEDYISITFKVTPDDDILSLNVVLGNSQA